MCVILFVLMFLLIGSVCFFVYCSCLFFEEYVDHRDLPVRTHSFPTRRSSDLQLDGLPSAPRRVARPVRRGTRSPAADGAGGGRPRGPVPGDRKSTRLNSSH